MVISPRVFWGTVAVIIGVGFGILGNPWLTTPADVVRALLYTEVAAALAWLFWELGRARRGAPAELPPPDPAPPADRRAWFVVAFVVLCWLGLYRERFLDPRPPIGDDAHYLRDSADWRTTCRHLLAPYNEHVVVPARLATFAVVSLAAALEVPVERVMPLVTLVLYLAALILVYRFARLWWRSQAPALLTVVCFAITTNHREIILWYSASQWLFSFCLLLVGLLAAAQSHERPYRRTAAAVMLVSFLGPFAYSVGVLVGPLCSLYLAARLAGRGTWPRRLLLAPLAATILGIALTAPVLWSWFGTDTYAQSGGRGPEVYSPGAGLVYILRLSVDLLVLRNLGLPALSSEPALLWLLPLGAATMVGLLRLRPALWRLWPHLALLYLPYACTIPFRTWVDYRSLTEWTRYQLFPQLGLALLLAGAARTLAPAWLPPTGRLTLRQGLVLMLWTLALWALQEGLAR